MLAVGVIAGVLTFAGTKALASNYNPSYQQEPVQAGQVMMPDDTTYEYYELIGDTNSGFEYPENEMDWVKNDSNVGDRGEIKLNSKFYPNAPLPSEHFDGEYSAEIKIRSEGFGDGYFEIDLSSPDTLKLGEFSSLNVALMRNQYKISLDKFNFRIDLIGEKEEVMDTITLAYGTKEEDTEHRFYKNLAGEDTLPNREWREKVYSQELKELINFYNLQEHKVKKLRFYLSSEVGGLEPMNLVGVDNVEAHFTRMIITGVQETPIQRTPELTDIILNPSNLYQATFPQRGTLTIYEASTGRRVQAPIQVYGHVDVDFSGFPAGVYFGVYKPQEGRQQVGKIIKTQ